MSVLRGIGLRHAGAAVFCAAIGFAVFGYGAVYRLPFLTVAFLICVSLALSPGGSPRNQGIRRVFNICVVLVVVLILYLVLQSVSIPGFRPDAILSQAGSILDFDFDSISVEPARTIRAIQPLVLPFLAFLAALALFDGDKRAFQLWSFLAGIGVVAAIIAVIQFSVYPEWVLFRRKEYYLDSLTGSFINQNTAATFFGMASLLVFGNLIRTIRSFRDSRIGLLSPWRPRYSNRGRLDQRAPVIFWSIGLIATLLALFLTQSRAGITSTALAFATATALVIHFELSHRASSWKRGLMVAVGVGVVVCVVVIFSGRTLLRLEEKGFDDDRWCAFGYSLDAIADHPVFGTGFGTFSSVFPRYRIGPCAPEFQWEMAHNSYLEAYLGMGVPFLLILAASMSVLLVTLRIGFRQRRRYRFVPTVGLAMIILVAAHSLIDFSLQIPGIALYFAAGMAASTTLSLGRFRIEKRLSNADLRSISREPNQR